MCRGARLTTCARAMIGQQAAQNPVDLSVFTLPNNGYRLTFWMIYPMRFSSMNLVFLLL